MSIGITSDFSVHSSLCLRMYPSGMWCIHLVVYVTHKTVFPYGCEVPLRVHSSFCLYLFMLKSIAPGTSHVCVQIPGQYLSIVELHKGTVLVQQAPYVPCIYCLQILYLMEKEQL